MKILDDLQYQELAMSHLRVLAPQPRPIFLNKNRVYVELEDAKRCSLVIVPYGPSPATTLTVNRLIGEGDSMSELEDALTDLFREVAAGRDFDAIADEIAGEYGLNSNLLKRRFCERYFSPELAKEKATNTTRFSTTTLVDYAKAEAFLRSECEKLGIQVQFFLPIANKKEVCIKFFVENGVPSCRVLNLVDCTVEVRPAFSTR